MTAPNLTFTIETNFSCYLNPMTKIMKQGLQIVQLKKQKGNTFSPLKW